MLSAIENGLACLRTARAQVELAASTPKPLIVIEWGDKWHKSEFCSAMTFLMFGFDESGGDAR